jgi:methylase of polypeptide subunit release factors
MSPISDANGELEFTYLWDACVHQHLYNPGAFVEQFCAMLETVGVTKGSPILDACAGSGFPALLMWEKGYHNIACTDASDDQIEFFNCKAHEKQIPLRAAKCPWQDLPARFQGKRFQALICKGSIWPTLPR